MANVLEQRFVSRIYDHRRALRGRSPALAALAHARRLGERPEQLLRSVGALQQRGRKLCIHSRRGRIDVHAHIG